MERLAPEKRFVLKVLYITALVACVSVMLLLFQNCAASSDEPTALGGDEEESNDPYVRSSITVEHEGDTIAFVHTFGLDTVGLYLPKEDVYVGVDINTGTYKELTGYFSGPNCTGNLLYILPSEAGGRSDKTVGRIGENFYRIKKPYAQRPTAKYLSTLYPSDWYPYQDQAACVTQANPVSWGDNVVYSFEETSRPYDFESIAPLNIKF